MDNTEWDLFATVWVSVDRTQHCLSNYVAPYYPDFAKNTTTAIGARTRSIYKQSDHAIGSFLALQARRPDPVHQRPRVRELHVRRTWTTCCTSSATWSSASQRDLRPDAVGAGAERRAQGVRPARPARQGQPPAVRGTGRRRRRTPRSAPQVRASSTGRDVDGIVDPADFERVRGEVMDRLASFVDPKTDKKPVKAIYKREDVFKGKHA